uniref:Cytochrome c biogenesis protein CcsB n=1 Tax=Neotessella volvocina TaxID=52559 RepID=A0A3G2R009_9STRA|nr:c-type cytochrome biogenensis protein [Neotessella volvocina]AYO28763.1 c-type cytochrome biogenensis protein [Neotessella volvocina]
MKFLKIKTYLKFFIGVKFAILILALIALASSLGSIIEQDETLIFYQENYPKLHPIFGILSWEQIINFGFDHIYRTWWFLSLLLFLVISLISCTITRQFPIFNNSKESLFREKKKSFLCLPFFVKIKKISYLKEILLFKSQSLDFYLYQKGKLIYGYKGIIGRLSPILVHFSLIVVLLGSCFGAFQNFKAQEILPKGELFHIQNPIQIGWFTSLPNLSTRVNDFWVEYDNNRVHQFYSNISILDNLGNEIKEQTISVNNPLRYNQLDFYQSDWNLLGIRFQKNNERIIYESPLFSLQKQSKAWITWIVNEKQNFTIIFDQYQNTFNIYDEFGTFIKTNNIGDKIFLDIRILDLLPATGLLIKYDPSILIIYLGFGILMLTACLSYLPYTQIWIYTDFQASWLGGSTNRGKIQLEIEFENFIRSIEKILQKNRFIIQ